VKGGAFLLRLDDAVPEANWSVWERLEDLFMALSVRPIIAVVPDNQDPSLRHANPDPGFWERVRRWQASGWSIGLHGFQHRYVTQSRGLVGMRAASEFAGLSRDAQLGKLGAALSIFSREGVSPDLWVAPGHSFDATTLSLLLDAGIDKTSDGFGVWPARDRHGMLWVPQQLWKFRRRPFGVWTVCLHPSRWGDRDFERFARSVDRYQSRIVPFEQVVAMYGQRRASPTDTVLASLLRATEIARGKIAGVLR
jgi:predicted deacetylase